MNACWKSAAFIVRTALRTVRDGDDDGELRGFETKCDRR
jgi:hypothetical protein